MSSHAHFMIFANGADISKAARNNYMKLVYKCSDKKFKEDVEFSSEGTKYRSGRRILVRNMSPEDVIEYIVKCMNISDVMLHMKKAKGVVEAKAMLVILMRSIAFATSAVPIFVAYLEI